MLGDRGQAVTRPAYVTWVGHATLLVELAGVRVLTDPVLTQRIGHLRRRTAPPAAATRRTDVVVISHAHGDHLHRRSLRMVLEASPRALVVVPRGAAVHLPALGSARVEEVVAGDVIERDGLWIEGLPRWLPETARRFERALAERGMLDLLVRLEPGETARW